MQPEDHFTRDGFGLFFFGGGGGDIVKNVFTAAIFHSYPKLCRSNHLKMFRDHAHEEL